ncbi:PIN domain-containing protein [Oscillatoria laete-virens NRMC-F 0139]|nr:PIN domain-containing protein [Oscillatoria laete-virens]MDL5055777.1 PIN domain-containing protein [Oscillatoria laete-virens NRMC-F 0139]
MKAVIDSDVLIDYLQGVTQAKLEIDRYSEPLYSIISWMEIMCGAQNDDERLAARTLFASMEQVDLSQKVAEIAVVERMKQKLKLPDAVILATADSEGCILVTRNTKDFDQNDPRVRIPYFL